MKYKVSDVNVWGYIESMSAARLPKQLNAEFSSKEFFNSFGNTKELCDKLALCKSGTGHDCFLKGIIVQMNITAPIYWWAQWDRYHFQDTVSSQSTMHKILEMDIERQCNEYTHPVVVEVTQALIDEWHKLKAQGADASLLSLQFQRIVATAPRGLCLTRRVTTNYLQLKSMYLQRKHHKLVEWHEFFEGLLPELIYTEWITGE